MPGRHADLVRGGAELEEDVLRERASSAPAVDEEQVPLLVRTDEVQVAVPQVGRFPRPGRAHDERSPN